MDMLLFRESSMGTLPVYEDPMRLKGLIFLPWGRRWDFSFTPLKQKGNLDCKDLELCENGPPS